MTDSDIPLIQMTGVKKVFLTDEVETHALAGVHLNIQRGDFVTVAGFIFQSFNLIGDLTVFENVELPLVYRSTPSSARKAMVREALEQVGMEHRLNHYPSQLSGGQQQRVAVARALVGKPLILLADEPTGNLDSRSGERVMELLAELHIDGATICMVTHDPRYLQYAERTIHLFDGQVVDETDPAVQEAMV